MLNGMFVNCCSIIFLESEIIEAAIIKILKNLPMLSLETYLLTTQIDTKLAKRVILLSIFHYNDVRVSVTGLDSSRPILLILIF